MTRICTRPGLLVAQNGKLCTSCDIEEPPPPPPPPPPVECPMFASPPPMMVDIRISSVMNDPARFAGDATLVNTVHEVPWRFHENPAICQWWLDSHGFFSGQFDLKLVFTAVLLSDLPNVRVQLQLNLMETVWSVVLNSKPEGNLVFLFFPAQRIFDIFADTNSANATVALDPNVF